MNNEYIIANKTAIEKRIQELEKDLEDEPNPFLNTSYQSELDVLKKILSQSTPLIDEIEKAWEDGRNGTGVVGNFPFVETKYVNKTSQDYISNLKLV